MSLIWVIKVEVNRGIHIDRIRRNDLKKFVIRRTGKSVFWLIVPGRNFSDSVYRVSCEELQVIRIV